MQVFKEYYIRLNLKKSLKFYFCIHLNLQIIDILLWFINFKQGQGSVNVPFISSW